MMKSLPNIFKKSLELNPSSPTALLGSNYFYVPNTPVSDFWSLDVSASFTGLSQDNESEKQTATK